jgi:TrmH RNA methyltransferase
MQRAMIDRCDARISIPGSGKVESLNIATAVAVVLAEHWRQHAVK